MDSTDGLQRGMEVVPTGHHFDAYRNQIKGRVMNVVGETIDGMKELDKTDGVSIHREPPKFEDLATTQEVFFTGIKVIDLLEPYLKGGKIGLFGGAGVGKTVLIKELINNIAKNTMVSPCLPVWVNVPVKVTTCWVKWLNLGYPLRRRVLKSMEEGNWDLSKVDYSTKWKNRR